MRVKFAKVVHISFSSLEDERLLVSGVRLAIMQPLLGYSARANRRLTVTIECVSFSEGGFHHRRRCKMIGQWPRQRRGVIGPKRVGLNQNKRRVSQHDARGPPFRRPHTQIGRLLRTPRAPAADHRVSSLGAAFCLGGVKALSREVESTLEGHRGMDALHAAYRRRPAHHDR